VGILEVTDADDMMIITKAGTAIRMHVDEVRVIGRNTQGVRLINLRDGDEISSVTRIAREEDVEIEGDAVAPIAPVDSPEEPSSDQMA
jgi:DNA gyrase subunit A